MRVHLSSLRADIEEICKDLKRCHSFNFFFFVLENIIIFHKILYYICQNVKLVITILSGLIWSWSSNILATWYEELTHWKRPWCWKRLKAGGEGGDRGWDGWMASLTQWTWVWVNSRSWWWTGRPGVLQCMGSQRVGYGWVTELK